MFKKFSIATQQRYQLIDITTKVEKIIEEIKFQSGLIFIFVPHSTAAILLTENETGLIQDWLKVLRKIISGQDFLHNRIDNNADSHILSGLIGQGKTLIVENNRIIRGTWQQIFLVELDGAKNREIIIKFIKN
jgi:secondary thiamine-phosphate synthase enzyme